MTDTRSSAHIKRAEQLQRWGNSATNNETQNPKNASKIRFSPGVVFLAACAAGDKEEVQRLLQMGTDINTANMDGLTPLHLACIDDNMDMVEFLVGQGADINRADNEGWSPLHATASCGFVSIARFLLENGADVAAVNYDRELPMDIADSDGMVDLLKSVIDEKGIDCDISRNAEHNKMMADARTWAANGYVEVEDKNTGGTPLHVAAAKGYSDVAKVLLEECEVDANSLDFDGWTPLHAAAYCGQKDTCLLLLKHGADTTNADYSGQTVLDLVDSSIADWLSHELVKEARQRKNNNKIKRTPPSMVPKPQHIELEITSKPDKINDKPPSPVHIITESKPPKVKPPSPETTPEPSEPTTNNDPSPPTWRRMIQARPKSNEPTSDNVAKTRNNNTIVYGKAINLRRAHSYDGENIINGRIVDATPVEATSCPSIATSSVRDERPINKPTDSTNQSTNDSKDEEVVTSLSPNTTAVRNATETVDLQNNVPAVPPANTPTKLSPGSIFKNFFKSFVPPVRDDESETRRKAHAKRVRETRRSTQGVTLDEIKSAEQLVKKKSGNGTNSTESVTKPEGDVTAASSESPARGVKKGEVTVSVALTVATTVNTTATTTATIAAAAGERRPSWRLRLDPTNKFELEDAVVAATTNSDVLSAPVDTTVTLPLRRPPIASTATTTVSSLPSKDDTVEKVSENATENKSPTSGLSPVSTQAAINVIQRRRRPKRRSTGVGNVDMDDIVNDRSSGGEGDTNEANQSGSERTTDDDTGVGEERDYKALYEASSAEVLRLRELLTTSELHLRDARATIARFNNVNKSSFSEEKRERRAIERKLSEMEEELKIHVALQAENQRLKDENGALIRVISKLSK